MKKVFHEGVSTDNVNATKGKKLINIGKGPTVPWGTITGRSWKMQEKSKESKAVKIDRHFMTLERA